ncbi:MAG: neutral zinc metallopeptidase, partial [Chitinophagaceae bacterium]|nr:neutral zinc metallopeptidase [Chitinophagaceae bacterium]
MLWKGRRESGNVDDRRGFSGGKVAAGGGIIGIIIVVVNLLMGGNVDISQIQQQLPAGQTQQLSTEEQALDDERASFVKVVLADTEDVWNKIMNEQGKQYQEPKLVLFRDRVQSACGMAGSASGPFYCPGDQQVYIDLSFY